MQVKIKIKSKDHMNLWAFGSSLYETYGELPFWVEVTERGYENEEFVISKEYVTCFFDVVDIIK